MTRRVWLVDDDEDLAMAFGVIFKDAGFAFEAFENGAQFFERWNDEPARPDVLLIDIRLPGTNGIEIIRTARQADSNVAIIVVTALHSESATINAFESGADDVLKKPLSVAEMLARINWHLGRQTRIGELTQQGEDFRLLMELSHVLSRSTNVPETLRALIDGLREALRVETAAVYIADSQSGELHRALPAEPSRTDASPNPTFDLRDLPVVADALASRDVAYLEPTLTQKLMRAIGGAWPEPQDVRTSGIFPMILHDEFIGVLVTVARRERFGWFPREQYIGSIIADFAAVAVHRAGLVDSIRQEHMRVDHASRELEKTRDYFSNLVMSSPDAIVAADISGAVFVINRAAEAILGYGLQEVVGMDVRKLYPSGDAESIMISMRSNDQGRLEKRRGTLVHKDGSLIPVEISAAIIFDGENEEATVGVFTDLRGRLQMQEQLQQAHDSLEESEKRAVLAELAGAAAHELNQPLTSLLGYVELLEKKLVDQPQHQKLIGSISNESNRVAEIVKKIGRITDYKTKEYVSGTTILDLDQASEVEEIEPFPQPDSADLLDSIPSAVGLSDERGNLLQLNRAARDFLGIDVGLPSLDLTSRQTSQGMRSSGGEFYMSDVKVIGAKRERASLTLRPFEGSELNRVLFEIPGGESGSPSVRMLEVLTNALRHVGLLRTPEKILDLLVRSFAEVFPLYSVAIGVDQTRVHFSGWGEQPRNVTAHTIIGQFSDPALMEWEESNRAFRTRFDSVQGASWVQVEKREDEKFALDEREAFETFAQQVAFAAGRGADISVEPIMNHLDAIIAICNTKRQIDVSNETFDQLVHADVVVGRDVIEFFDEEGRELLRNAISTTLAGGVVDPFDAVLLSDGRSGVRLQVQVHGNRAGDPLTPPLGVIVIGQQSELSLVEIDQRMERAEQLFSLGQLATGVAHELKNPLTSILNYADYLRQKYQGSLFDARDAERLGRIIEGVEQIDTFIKDLVTLARPESGPHESIDLGIVMQEAAALCEVYWDRHQVTFSAAPSLSRVRGNRVHLRQVFVNLFTNAASAMPAGGGHIGVSFENVEGRVRCFVRDTANGIAPEVQARIFEPFFTTRAGHGGSGLGLAIVHQIIKQHNGSIDVTSEVGVGTVFTLELPAA